MSKTTDPYELSRFVVAQESLYEVAFSEVSSGAKKSHWMWFVFPQLKELGNSPIAVKYGIADLDEACAYLHHPILGPRLTSISNALLSVEALSATQILGSPDDLKLRSCATLFSKVENTNTVFDKIIKRYYNGIPDSRTLELL